jgi:prephenate dehydrogenase
MRNVTVIGLGLIGGSMALDLHKKRFAKHFIGVDQHTAHTEEALRLKLVDEIKNLEEGVKSADVVILAIPVDAARKVILSVIDLLPTGCVLIDVGSTKSGICEVVQHHPKRAQYVACHPIAGTEFSGPAAAHYGLFTNKVNIICDKELSSENSLSVAHELFDSLEMRTAYMGAEEHDRHIAYVSHLSHVTSFTLGLTVLDIESNEKNIFNMAGSGFASTVRLAKSSADMWSPIFEQNSENLVEALDAYIDKLQVFRDAIVSKDRAQTHKLITKGNDIRRILEGIELKNKEKNGTNS